MNGMMIHFPILAIMSFFMGAFLVALVGRYSGKAAKTLVFAAVTIPVILILMLIKPVMLSGEIITYWMGGWEPAAGYAIGISLTVDALSLFFALIVVTAVFASGVYAFTYMNRDEEVESYYSLFLVLSGSVLGLVLSGDLFNMFVMVEIMTFTAVALTAFRVDEPGALEGAMKYMVVGSVGSTAILAGTAIVYAQLHTLNLAQIGQFLSKGDGKVMAVAFALLFVGFSTKAFLFPFHPLAADAHAVAPASISLMISGVLTKCGVYGIIRLCYTIFRNIDTPFVSLMVTVFGAVSCFICVTMAFNQHNFKRLLAFHSISQVGYVIAAVGLGSIIGLEAGLFHAMNHTLFKGLLFLTAGAVQYATGSLNLDRLGGLFKKMPHTGVLFLIGAASISGLPPFNGFASKWMIYQAAFEKSAESGNFIYMIAAVMLLLSSVLTLASFVKVTQSVFFGQRNPVFEDTKEVPLAMRIPMMLLAALCVLTGLFPSFVERVLLKNAAKAAVSAAGYLDSVMGTGTAAAAGISDAFAEASFIGVFNPIAFILLLLTATAAILIVSVSARSAKTFAAAENHVKSEGSGIADEPDPKYEPFFSGEKSEYSQVGGEDLFWGFKSVLKPYFSYMRNWHSGVVNDYAAYGIVSLSVVVLLCFLFIG